LIKDRDLSLLLVTLDSQVACHYRLILKIYWWAAISIRVNALDEFQGTIILQSMHYGIVIHCPTVVKFRISHQIRSSDGLPALLFVKVRGDVRRARDLGWGIIR
jgi:hypothetical protein